jgi:hypothetical protein
MHTWDAGRGPGALTWLLAGAATLALGAPLVPAMRAGSPPPAARPLGATTASAEGDASASTGRSVEPPAAGGGADDDEPPPAAKPQRGITPPWRESLIPELRHQPGKRARKYTS